MSLELVMSEKTIKNRYSLLSDYLTNNNIGVLPEPEIIFFNRIYETYCTPDKNGVKFHVSQFSIVKIESGSGSKCFKVRVDNKWHFVHIKRLSGSSSKNQEPTP